jgi:hypothetical protein
MLWSNKHLLCADSKEIQERESFDKKIDLIPGGSIRAKRHVTDGCVAGWSRRARESGSQSRKDSGVGSVQPGISGGRFGVHGLTRLAMPAHNSYFT